MSSIPTRYWIAIACVHSLAVFASWMIGLWLWFSSDALVFGYFVAFVLPVAIAVFVTSFVVDPSKTSGAFVGGEDDTPLTRRISMALAPFLLGAVAAGPLLHLGWSSPAVRAYGVELAADLGWLEPAENGLLGIAPEVRLAACRVAHQRELDSERLWASISSSPSPEVTSCLLGVLPGGSGRVLVIRDLARRWGNDLEDQELAPETACRTASWIAQTDRLGNDLAAAELLDCALSAPSVASQICCGQSIRALTRGAPVRSILPGPKTFLESPESGRLHVWMELSRPTALDPRVDEFLDWSGAENRAALNSLACQLADSHEASLEVLRSELKRIPACGSLEFGRQVLREACDEGPTRLEVICSRVQTALRERALVGARDAVELASSLARLASRPSLRFADTDEAGRDPRPTSGQSLTRRLLERMQREHGEPVSFESLDLLEFMKQQRTPK